MRFLRSLPLPLLVACCVVGCGGSSDSGDDDDSGGTTSDGGSGGSGSHADGSTDATAGGGGDGSSGGGGGGGGGSDDAGSGGGSDAAGGKGDAGPGAEGGTPPQQTVNGNPAGKCVVPTGAGPEDVSSPTTVVGTGTAASCTATAFANAVKAGGVVTFDCGADPITLVVPQISILNNGGKTADGSVTIDGGNKVTLSGNHANQILHQDTCDSTLVYTSSHCQDQATPHLVVQNIAFTAGKVAGSSSGAQFGGGALYVSGGTFKAYNISVTDSQQTTLDQDVSGGAIYTFNQATQPVTIVQSTFDGNSGASGGALGSIGTSWTLVNDLFSNNAATGNGENPKQPGTTGGGLGGAVYNDGNSYTLSSCGTLFSKNTAPDLGSGAIFQVVDDLKGKLVLNQSTFSGNSNTGAVQGTKHPQIYVEAADKTGGAGVTISSDTVFE